MTPSRMRIGMGMLLAVGICLAPVVARAASLRFELPALSGAYEQPGDHRSATLDLGASFSAIESITVELELADADYGGLCTDSIPGACTAGTHFNVVLQGAGGDSLVSGVSGLRRNSLNAFGLSPGGVFDPVLGFIPNPWPDFLLNGSTSLDLALTGLPGPGIIPPGFHRGEVLSAAVVVVGTAVPEPSTAANGLLGLALLVAYTRAGGVLRDLKRLF